MTEQSISRLPVPICADCRHHRAHTHWWQIFGPVHECARGRIDLVTGDPCVVECAAERAEGDCGKAGRFYEPNAREP